MDPEEERQQEETAPGEITQEEGATGEEVLAEERPSFAASVAEKAGAAAERTGAAARRLLEGLGTKLTTASSPPVQSILPEDDLSDLFEGPDMSRDNDVYIDDLVSVNDEDVFGEGGADMSDILEVTDEDLMGTEDYLGNARDKVATQARRPFVRVVPPTEVSGLQ